MRKFGYDKFDQVSYEIGIAACFVEMVSLGLKPIALSSPIDEKNKTIVSNAIGELAKEYEVKIYEENELIENNIATKEYADGKMVLIIYKDDKEKEDYLRLKKEEKLAKEKGLYNIDVKNKISIEFCRILGYPEKEIMERFAIESNDLTTL